MPSGRGIHVPLPPVNRVDVVLVALILNVLVLLPSRVALIIYLLHLAVALLGGIEARLVAAHPFLVVSRRYRGLVVYGPGVVLIHLPRVCIPRVQVLRAIQNGRSFAFYFGVDRRRCSDVVDVHDVPIRIGIRAVHHLELLAHRILLRVGFCGVGDVPARVRQRHHRAIHFPFPRCVRIFLWGNVHYANAGVFLRKVAEHQLLQSLGGRHHRRVRAGLVHGQGGVVGSFYVQVPLLRLEMNVDVFPSVGDPHIRRGVVDAVEDLPDDSAFHVVSLGYVDGQGGKVVLQILHQDRSGGRGLSRRTTVSRFFGEGGRGGFVDMKGYDVRIVMGRGLFSTDFRFGIRLTRKGEKGEQRGQEGSKASHDRLVSILSTSSREVNRTENRRGNFQAEKTGFIRRAAL